jgi:hypothetical protein
LFRVLSLCGLCASVVNPACYRIWVRLARFVPRLMPVPPPSSLQIGFVFHCHPARHFSSNPLYCKHLASISSHRELGLFGTIGSVTHPCPDTPSCPRLALFGAIGMSLEWWNGGAPRPAQMPEIGFVWRNRPSTLAMSCAWHFRLHPSHLHLLPNWLRLYTVPQLTTDYRLLALFCMNLHHGDAEITEPEPSHARRGDEDCLCMAKV